MDLTTKEPKTLTSYYWFHHAQWHHVAAQLNADILDADRDVTTQASETLLHSKCSHVLTVAISGLAGCQHEVNFQNKTPCTDPQSYHIKTDNK